MQETYLTKEGEAKLRAELEELKGARREDIARRLRIAIQQGDLSENADYIATKEEQGFVEGRILELEQMLRNVIIIEDNHTKRDVVEIGAHVTIQEADYPPETYFVVGVNEANPREGKISFESPIGRALIGKKVGDTAVANPPGGEIRFKVIRIE
jgi:transcription elongation factor GreA